MHLTKQISRPKPEPRKLVYHWYALYTKPRHEKKVYAEVLKNGFIAYLPLEKKIRQWHDRKKKVEEPLIRSYVFVKSSEREYYDILNINGALSYVRFEGKAASIPDWQIEAMKKMLDHNIPHHYSGERFLKGEKVLIESGPLKGYEGEIIKDNKRNSKLVIQIGKIGYSLVIEDQFPKLKKLLSLPAKS